MSGSPFKSSVQSTETCFLRNFPVHGAEICPEFLESWSVSGVVLPAVVHNPGNLHGAGVWCRHTVSWNTPQSIRTGTQRLLPHPRDSPRATKTSESRLCLWMMRFPTVLVAIFSRGFYLSPPHPASAGCSCSCKVSDPEKKSPTAKYQSSTRHSLWYSDLKTPAGGSIGKVTAQEEPWVWGAGRQPSPTVVQGLRSRPFHGDLLETTLCQIHPIVVLTGHPEVTDLHWVVLCNQTVSGCQIPLGKNIQTKTAGTEIKWWWKTDGGTGGHKNIIF